MALPWVRMDSHIASHDKILGLLADPSPKRWQAAFSYVCSIGWSGDQGTDGRIPQAALPFVHGTATTARLLVKYGLWDERTAAWEIRNFATRQELSVVRAGKMEMRRLASEKANCARWHGKDCWTGVRCGHAVA